jgi:hypothetical protein
MNALHDPEVVELLREEPELLALADAMAATQRVRRRVPMRVPALAAAVLAAAAVALLAPWGGSGPDIVEDALAAIGTGAVVHAAVEYRTDDSIVDLDTGKSTPRVRRTEYWYDAERQLLHTKLFTDGVQITEIVEGPQMAHSDIGSFETNGFSPQLDPALAGFATGYREALEDGTAREVGKTKIGLREVTLLAFQRGTREVLTVAVDDDSGRPVRFWSIYPGGRRSPDFDVVELETLGRSPTLFERPELSPPRPTAGSGQEGRPIAIEEAAAALGAQPVWLGPSFRGRTLESIERSPVTAELTDGTRVEGVVLRFTYGRTRVSVAKTAAGAYALGMEDGGDPPPAPGSVALMRPSGGPRDWSGELRSNSLYVAISAPTSTEVVDAARGLRLLER